MKRKKLRIILAVCFGLTVFATVVLFFGRQDLRFVLSELVRIPDKKQLPNRLNEQTLELREYSYSELLNDERVSFDDSLLLINEKHTLPAGYNPTIENYGDSEHKLNTTAIQKFEELAIAVKENCNQDLLIISAYRNKEEQLRTIEEEGELAAEANASEHLTGLAIDVCVRYFGGQAFLKSEAGRFVNTNCGDYGFIIRYPLLSESITGIKYEPWHIRYVGLPHSYIISAAKLTFEEYIEYFEKGKLYSFNEYIITRQPKDVIKLPKEFEHANISEDNSGCYFITLF